MSYTEPGAPPPTRVVTRIGLVLSAAWIVLAAFVLSTILLVGLAPCGNICDQAEPVIGAALFAPYAGAGLAAALALAALLPRVPRWLIRFALFADAALALAAVAILIPVLAA